MIASYKNDMAKGPGFGLLEIKEVPFNGDCVFNLARASDHSYLGTDGWGTVRSDLTPLAQSRQNGLLLLYLSPSMVARLDAQENYRIFLKPADGSGTAVSARLQMENILYAPEGCTGSLTEAAMPEPSAQEQIVPPQPEPEPVQSEAAPSTSPIPPVDPLSMNNEPASSKFPWIWLVAGLLLLALVCTAVWWFCLRKTPAEPPIENTAAISEETSAEPDNAPASTVEEQDVSQETPAEQKNSAVADQPLQEKKEETPQAAPHSINASEPSPAPVPEKQENTPPPSVQYRVNEFLRSPERTPQKAAALGNSIQASTPEEQDALYRLYYYAAENGDTSLLLPYAACHDPSKPQWGSIEKDAIYAMQIYNKASGPEAEAAKEALRAWVKRDADNG
ncbi:MAG: hypothetical protein J5556_02960, partial [Deltaproteobacteria bacterium]|nr:hypothetical protein [Deltaproteobacteria bacterium]